MKILLVDDMPAMRNIVRGMLEDAGFKTVVEVEDGEAAWELVSQSAGDVSEAFDLVISDWRMPGMTGVDLLRAVRSSAQTRGLPFLMITSQGDQAHITEAVRAGVTEYIVKPFNGPQLAEKVRSALKL